MLRGAAHRAVASPHWVALTALRVVAVTQQQPPYKSNGAMPEHDRAARRWLLRRWECVPSLRGWLRLLDPLHTQLDSRPTIPSESPPVHTASAIRDTWSVTASMTDGFASWSQNLPCWIQGTSVNNTIEICVYDFMHKLHTVLHQGHGPRVNRVSGSAVTCGGNRGTSRAGIR